MTSPTNLILQGYGINALLHLENIKSKEEKRGRQEIWREVRLHQVHARSVEHLFSEQAGNTRIM
jgi:hypothetical protein